MPARDLGRPSRPRHRRDALRLLELQTNGMSWGKRLSARSARIAQVRWRRHTLLIDADDTLCETNVFFEKLSSIQSASLSRTATPALTFAISAMKRTKKSAYGYGVERRR